jgi:hypothetical protein
MRPSVTFTVPDGLILRYDKIDDIWLSTSYAPAGPNFDIVIADQPDTVDRIASDERSHATAPVDITVDGRPARSVDIAVPAGLYIQQGQRGTWISDALEIAGLNNAGWYIYAAAGQRGRLIELRVGDRDVLIFYQAPIDTFHDFAAICEQIVESLHFTS